MHQNYISYIFLSGILTHVVGVTINDERVEFTTPGISALLPKNAAALGRLIHISIITDISKYLKVRDDEICVAFGVLCLPKGLQLRSPMTVVIPHCGLFPRWARVTPVVYAGTGELGLKAWQIDIRFRIYLAFYEFRILFDYISFCKTIIPSSPEKSIQWEHYLASNYSNYSQTYCVGKSKIYSCRFKSLFHISTQMCNELGFWKYIDFLNLPM